MLLNITVLNCIRLTDNYKCTLTLIIIILFYWIIVTTILKHIRKLENISKMISKILLRYLEKNIIEVFDVLKIIDVF